MKSPFKTFLKFSLGTWINAVVSVISVPIITWFILPDELGKATMFTLAYNLLLNFFLLGQDQSFARHYNEVEDSNRPQLLLNTITPTMVMSVVGIVLIESFRKDLSNLLFSNQQAVRYVDFLAMVLPCGVISRFAQLIIRMKGRALAYSMIQVLLTSTNLIFTILYAKIIAADFSAIIISFVFSQIICLMASLLIERSIWHSALRSEIVMKYLTTQLRFGIPFVPTFVFDWLFQSSDRTFLRIYSTFSEIGIYSTATRISAGLNIIQTGFSTFWIPFVYQKYSEDAIDKSFYQLVFESIYLTFALAIVVILLCKNLILLILPPEYYSSIAIFPLILFVPMLYTLSEITGVGINLKKKTVYHFYILTAAAIISLVMGFVLIRVYGAKGAIITNFCSYFAFFVLRSILGGRLYPLPLDWKKFAFTFAIVFAPVMYIFIWPLSSPYLLLIICLTIVILLHTKTLRILWIKVSSLLLKK